MPANRPQLMSFRRARRRSRWPLVVIVFSVFGLCGTLSAWYAYETDERVHFRVEEWRAQVWDALYQPADTVPTPVIVFTTLAKQPVTATLPPTPTSEAVATATATLPGPTATPEPTATPTPSPTPLPPRVMLTGFRHEYQKFNNCGPASLAVNLSYWGWQGTQADTARVLKPNQDDKNVSPIEMYNYITTLGFEGYIRVNGDVETLKRFIAAGYPVLVEKGFQCLPGEERCSGWFGHYSVFKGYDDARREFYMEDTFRGPNLALSYEETLTNWRAFNYLYMVIYPNTPEHDAAVEALLGPAVIDLEQNYRDALKRAQDEVYTLSGQDQAFAWFNIGTNLHWLRDYAGAARAYDEARLIGLPRRMLWYQFGPYRAYYYSGRYQDVYDLATFAIESSPKPGLEEAFYWRGLALEAFGQRDRAIEDYRQALMWNPADAEARGALTRLGVAP
ncbi:MAG: C39 family peptidase [Anaerolineales bacterium]|nr:C39 family peptidase [Anaerolineales bacterium]